MRAKVHNPELKRLWSRWLDVVCKVSHVAHRADRMPGEAYARLHASLLQTIESSLARDGRNAQARTLLQQMKVECSPWVSLESFATAEKRLLLNVADRSRGMLRQLGGRPAARRRTGFWVLTVAGLTAGCCLSWYTFFAGEFGEKSLTYAIRGRLYRWWIVTQRIDPLEWVAIVVVLVVIIGVGMLRSTRQF